ncbi:hypothetical protein ACQPYE_08190 [Actinosynnema sp. CA-299493]
MSLELSTRSRLAFEQARPGDVVRMGIRRSPVVHHLPAAPRPNAAGPAASEPVNGIGRLPTIAALHHRARVLLGLAMLGAVVVLLALGALAVVPLIVCTAAALVTFLQPPLRVTA